ncbi:MAG: hypothetical protein ACLFTI_11330 [Anaerolineales bacterium]
MLPSEETATTEQAQAEQKRNTALWYWFLFESNLATQRAKTLLAGWQKRDLSLEDVIARLPQEAQSLGLTPQEARQLRPPASISSIAPDAVGWDEPLYPGGLRDLPLSHRPALLFYRGARAPLQRPILYLPPAPLDTADEGTRELLQETLGIVLGEEYLPAAFHGSEQATLLLDAMHTIAGEVLFFTYAGLENIDLSKQERAYLADERLILATPLPPQTPANPAWESILRQTAEAAAARCLGHDLASIQQNEKLRRPTLLIRNEAPEGDLPAHIHVAATPTDVLLWLAGASETPEPASAGADDLLASPSEPPPTPEETLRILEAGGDVPDAIKKRLLGK